ncbi:type II toxin-antitoxin system RelE/ParE family toxin [Geobacter argillaceus]|uniref:Plasmid stabilization system protein ParE n=1 Tax=Geobacter argillaceus TaxID=345631 RepID=A0A562WRF3_9BACT|nr:type II toxin-antitoxin system RelE/ParE family toxin [Geobacter argillaceus]TWJ32978.1 plasmid stabilization system protein ParE [Geobacter argillaceus]
MVRLTWSEKAAADLEQIRDFIAVDSLFYARVQIERLITAVGRLLHFPESGRSLPEFPHLPHRELIAGSYRIIYRYEPAAEAVMIVTVVHSARLLQQDQIA